MSKRILFLSALDFKRKSIQVILNTPVAFAKAGWDVHYVVSRDTSKYGNYFYEEPFDPAGIAVHRTRYAFTSFYDNIGWGLLRIIVSKLRGYVNDFKLAAIGNRLMRQQKFDVVYGYEQNGTLALTLLRLFGRLRGVKTVTRFQGSFVYGDYASGRWHKFLLSWDTFIPLFLPSDLLIMTNDGTQGDKALGIFGKRNPDKMKFWVNGVDDIMRDIDEVEAFRQEHMHGRHWMFITVCRLESWKRVDRALRVVAHVVHELGFTDFRHFIVGDGVERERLQALARELDIMDNVNFVGAVAFSEMTLFMNAADIMISTYDASNVGNPLLEAIRTNKIIFTLNNGDTSSWIKHKENGFIYDIVDNMVESMAKDIVDLTGNEPLFRTLKAGIMATEQEKLWTWQQRMEAEVRAVNQLLEQGNA